MPFTPNRSRKGATDPVRGALAGGIRFPRVHLRRVSEHSQVESSDFMTADFYPMDMKLLGKISSRIINEVKGINRVVYDISSKPPSTIEWE